MTDEMSGKVPAKITGRAKPTVLTVGKKALIPGGRWNHELVADYVIAQATSRWMTIGELAYFGCGSNSIPNKRKVRHRLPLLFMEFLKRNLLLAIEYEGTHNSASKVKVADLAADYERELVQARVERMRKRKEMTEDQYQKSMKLLTIEPSKE